MPGSIPLATPTTVLPLSLSRAFTLDLEYLAIANNYANGEIQVGVVADAPRRSWTLTKRLTSPNMAALQAFITARNGGFKSFRFYDPYMSNFAYDPTGVATTGRYTVVFEGGFSLTGGLARSDAAIKLRQVA